MFGSLKKRLKEAVEKVSKIVTSEDMAQLSEPVAAKTETQPINVEPYIDHKIEKDEIKVEKVEEIKNIESAAKTVFTNVEEIVKEMPKIETKIDRPSIEKMIEEAPVSKPDFEEELEKRIEELQELRDKVIEERLPPEIAESKLEVEEVIKEEKKSLFKRISEKQLTESEVENIMKELSIALLENDVAVEVADKISRDVKKELVGSSVKRGQVDQIIRNALRHAMLNVMQQEQIDIESLINNKQGPLMIMMVGFNGTGKTTTLAKLAHKLGKYKPVLAAADTFRAASIEQLEEHGRRLNMRVIKHTYGADAAAVIFDAKKHAEASGNKLVLADTAGRSHSNVNLMDELKKVARVNNPDLKILVLDSVTGNDIYDQCNLFNEAVGVDAIILTKADVYEKGGAALSAAYTLKKPILYIGIGQEYDDLKEFKPEEIVNNILN